MRFRSGSSVLYPALLSATLAIAVLVSGGCSGGSSNRSTGATPTPGTTPTPTPTTPGTPTPTPPPANPVAVRAVVNWGPRASRNILAPSSARSGRIVLRDNTGTTVATLLVARADGNLGGPQEYVSSEAVPPGNYTLIAEFYEGTDPGQTNPLVVATASAAVTVAADGRINQTISTVGRIASVEVVPGQVVRLEETKPVLFTARDTNGAVLAISPGAAFVSIAPGNNAGNAAIVENNQIRGLNPNRVSVQVRVDNAVSPAAEIIVRSLLTFTPESFDVTVSRGLVQNFEIAAQNDAAAPERRGFTFTANGPVGTLEKTGDYSARLTATETDGVYTITARSIYDPDLTIPITVRVQSLVGVSIQNAPEFLDIRDSVDLNATVTNIPAGRDAGVTWRVETQGGGTINADGLYTAPAVVPNVTDGAVQITARSNYDNTKVATVTVKVRSRVAVVVPNAPEFLDIYDSVDLNAQVSNTIPNGDTSVTWTVDTPNGGAINADGVYTAPAVVPGTPDGAVQITARSNYDPTVARTVTIKVRSRVEVDIPNAPAQVDIYDTVDLNAVVSNVVATVPNNQAVTWTISPATGAGTVDANTGVYTAPATLPNTPNNEVQITARSNYDPTKSETITFRVVSRVNVRILNAPAAIDIFDTIDLNAAVDNVLPSVPNNQAVVWTISPATGFGTINANTGVYTAPAVVPTTGGGNVTVRATSVYDPTRFAEATFPIISRVQVDINPKPTAISVRASVQLTSTVTGTLPGGDTSVTWSLDPTSANGGGSITATGFYTAPQTPPAGGGLVRIRATSNYDPTRSRTITIKVQAGTLPIIIQ